LDHATALLKTGVAIGDWICTRHRDTLRQRVIDATPQLMVWQCALHALLHVLMGVRLLQTDDDDDPAMVAAAAALNTLRRHSNVRRSFYSDAQRHIRTHMHHMLLFVCAGSRR
jgi:hypothetical protein